MPSLSSSRSMLSGTPSPSLSVSVTTASIAAGLTQALAEAVTVILPLGMPTVVLIELVVEDPVQPVGRVQL